MDIGAYEFFIVVLDDFVIRWHCDLMALLSYCMKPARLVQPITCCGMEVILHKKLSSVKISRWYSTAHISLTAYLGHFWKVNFGFIKKKEMFSIFFC